MGGLHAGKYWVLNPVDGTLGFVCGDQYAIALAMIEDGEVILGVLGCPNYPMKEWLNYHHRYYRVMSKLSPPTSGSWAKGCVVYAQKGSHEAWMQPLVHDGSNLVWPNSAEVFGVSSIDDPTLASFCEPVEKANSSHSFTEGLAHSVGLRGGVMFWADSLGSKYIYLRLHSWTQAYGDFFKPCTYLTDRAAKGASLDTERERISKLEEFENKANTQLERQLIMALEWSRTLLTVQGKLEGMEWDPENSHRIDFSEFWMLLNSNNVQFMEYSNFGQTYLRNIWSLTNM